MAKHKYFPSPKSVSPKWPTDTSSCSAFNVVNISEYIKLYTIFQNKSAKVEK